MNDYSKVINEEMDIAIINGRILTLDSNWTEFSPGLLLIKDGLIKYAGPSEEPGTYRAAKTIDARGGIVMPTFFNGHAHAAMSIFRGIGNDLPLDNWLNEHIWPAEAQFARPENVFLGSMVSAIEMIRGGTAIFADMYFFQEETIRACEEAGMRIIVGEGILDFPTPNKKTPAEGFEYTKYLHKKYKDHPLVSISLPAHSPYTCSPDVLAEVGELSRDLGIPATVHLAETVWEDREMKKRYGKSSTRMLFDLGFFRGKTVAYHCNHLSEEDIFILRDNNVGVVTNPRSNMKLGSGICPVTELAGQGIRIGIGTDGAASNNNQSVLRDMQLMARLQKMKHLDPTVINARQAIRMATGNNSEIYGLGGMMGSLEAGKFADIMIIDTDQSHWQPLYDPYSHIVYSMQPGDIVSTMVNGKLLMHDRRVLTVDEGNYIKLITELGATIKRRLSKTY